MRDPWEVLGVPRGAAPEQVRAAWKALARRFHPDLNPGDPRAAEAFQQVAEAFESISKGEADPGLGRGTRPPDAPPPRRGQDVRVELEVDCWTWLAGGSVSARLEAYFPCRACRGAGRVAGLGPAPCGRCRGSGRVMEHGRPVACVACDGRGVVTGRPCAPCQGQGHELRADTLTFQLPPGRVPSWTVPRLGGPGVSGGPRGDVVVALTCPPPPGTWFDGPDLVTALHLDLLSALRGGSASIDLPFGPVTIVVPPGAAEVVAPIDPHGRSHLRLQVQVALPQLAPDDAEAWAAAALLASRRTP